MLIAMGLVTVALIAVATAFSLATSEKRNAFAITIYASPDQFDYCTSSYDGRAPWIDRVPDLEHGPNLFKYHIIFFSNGPIPVGTTFPVAYKQYPTDVKIREGCIAGGKKINLHPVKFDGQTNPVELPYNEVVGDDAG
jgi:hypothetical protein